LKLSSVGFLGWARQASIRVMYSLAHLNEEQNFSSPGSKLKGGMEGGTDALHSRVSLQ